MSPRLTLPQLIAGLAMAGTLVTGVSAQSDSETLRATTRSKLEKPPAYDLPPLTSSTSSSRSSSSRSSTARPASGGIPDPSIFDGSQFPEEERPERGLIAQFEMPGQEPEENKQGPGEEQGGGPGNQQGNGPQNMAGGGGQQGMGGIPGMPGGGGGGDQQQGNPQMPTFESLEAVAESSQGDKGKEGGAGGEAGEQGEQGEAGAAGSEDAPQVAAGQKGRKLEKPSEVQIGDENAKLAASQIPTAEASRQLESEQGEDRMAIKAASGNQPANRGRGSERGVDIPSNL